MSALSPAKPTPHKFLCGMVQKHPDCRYPIHIALLLIIVSLLTSCANLGRNMDSVYWEVAVERDIYIHSLTTSRRDFYAVLAWLENVETGEVVFSLEPNAYDLETLLAMSFHTPPGRYRGVYSCDVTRLKAFNVITGIEHNQALKGLDHWGEQRISIGHVFDQTIPGGMQLSARNIRPRSGDLICTPLIADGRKSMLPATRRVEEAITRVEADDTFYLRWLE